MELRTGAGLIAVTLVVGVAGAETTNLVRNHGFETAAGTQPAQWSGPAAVYTRDAANAHAGKASLKFVNASADHYVLCTQDLPLQPGRRYEVSAWIRTESIVGSDSGATVCLEWRDKDGKYLGGSYPAGFKGTADWQELKSISGRLPENVASAHVVCYVRKGMTGKAWWDDVRVVRHLEDPLSTVLRTPNYRGMVTDSGPAEAIVRASLVLVDYELPLERIALGWTLTADEDATPVRRGFVRTVDAESTDVRVPVDGLARGRYRVDVSLFDKLTSACLSTKSHRLTRVGALPATYVDEHNRLILNGKPFFPLGMYWSGVNEGRLKTYADSAFNCLMPYGAADAEQMDLIHKHGLKIIYSIKDCYFGSTYCPKDLGSADEEYPYIKAKVEAHCDHPALLAWYLNDELPQSFMPRLEAHQQWLEELDPNHPTWVVLYQVGQVRDYVRTFDVIGTDPYPIPGSAARRAADWTRQTVDAVFDSRAVWQVPQMFNWATYRKTEEEKAALRPPTLEEMRSMAWQCIAEGATGLVFYSFFDLQRDKRFPFEKQWPKAKTVAEEISRFIPVILSVEAAPVVDVHARPWLHTLIRQHQGSTYLILVNDGPNAGFTHMRLPEAAGKPTVRLGVNTMSVAPNGVTRIGMEPFEAKVVQLTGLPVPSADS